MFNAYKYSSSAPGYNAKFNNVQSLTADIEDLTVTTINGIAPFPPAPPITAPIGSILSVINPGQAAFVQNILPNDVDITGDLQFNGNSGTTGKVIKKTTPTDQDWQDIVASDIFPGPANTVLTTNSTGTLSQFSSTISVNGDLRFNGDNGTPGQIIKKTSGTQIWTNDLGAKTADSITFNAANNTPLSYFETTTANLQLITVDLTGYSTVCTFTRIGNVVTMRIPSFAYSFIKGAGAVNNFVDIFQIPSRFRPSYGFSDPTTSPFLMDCSSCAVSTSQQQTLPTVGAITYGTGIAYVNTAGDVYIYYSDNRGLIPLTNGNTYELKYSDITFTWSIN